MKGPSTLTEGTDQGLSALHVSACECVRRSEVSLSGLPQVPSAFFCFYCSFMCLFSCMCLGVLLHSCLCTVCVQYLQRPEGGIRSPELDPQRLRATMWVLGTKPASSPGAACAVNHCANLIFMF